MRIFILLVLSFFVVHASQADEKVQATPLKETMLPQYVTEERNTALVTLEEVTKQAMQEASHKILSAKTETEAGKKIHVIKVLTAVGHIQYLKIDATTGKTVDNSKK